MTLKEAIETTPTGLVRNGTANREQCLVTLLGHVYRGNIKFELLLEDSWQWEMNMLLNAKPYKGYKLALAKLYLKRQNVL